MTKAKGMCIDPIKTKMNGQDIEMVELHKYLGTIIDHELSFDCNTNVLCTKKCPQRFFLSEEVG